MAIDPYGLCPCGSGKKVKFCCADLVGEIERIQRMIRGDQPAACLQHIESLEAKHPDHPFLLRMKAVLQGQLGEHEKAAETLDRLLSKNAQDTLALAEKAFLQIQQDDIAAGIASLQHALDVCDGKLPGSLARSIANVAEMLLVKGELLAARGHLMLAYGIHPENQHTMGLLVRLGMAEEIPLILKQDFSLVPCPADAPWKAEFEVALALFRKGRMAAAAQAFAELSERVADSPALWRNLATLRGWLADPAGAVAAWRSLAALDVPIEDAVEAEAMAQLLDPAGEPDLIDILEIDFPARDFDALGPLLSTDKRCQQFAFSADAGDDDEPPPRSAFWLLDRPMPDSGADLEIDAVPNVVGEIYLYPRQTDREARLQLHVAESRDVESTKQSVMQLAGDLLSEPAPPTAAGQIPAADDVLNWNWRLPRDTSPDRIHRLMAQKRRQVLLEQWPDVPLPELFGKTLRQAAGSPELRNAVLACILLMEQQTERGSVRFDFNELRAALDFPVLGPIDPAELADRKIPIQRLARVIVEKLTDDELLQSFQLAQMSGAAEALRRLGREVVARPQLDGRADKAKVLALLAHFEEDTAQALELLNQATALTVRSGESPARLLLGQLELRLDRGEGAEVGQLVQRLSTHHAKEPGVGQALFNMLYQAGLVGADGRPVVPLDAEPVGAAASGPDAPESGRLWTPDSQQPAGKKGALWTPGMD